VIVDFAHQEAERIWQGIPSRRLPPSIQGIARRKLRMLNNALTLNSTSQPAGGPEGRSERAAQHPHQ
jgi:proteic killer suppression protein